MKTYICGKSFEVKKTGSRYYYYSIKAGRWIPVKKEAVDFEGESENKLSKNN